VNTISSLHLLPSLLLSSPSLPFYSFVLTIKCAGSTATGGGGSALGAPVRILADFVKDVSMYNKRRIKKKKKEP
jgi:hypothetical protein